MSTGNEKAKSLDELRVYAPSRGNLALKSEALPRTRVAEPKPYEPVRRPKLTPVAPRPKRKTLLEVLREYKFLPKTLAVVVILAMAAALIVTISGFNNISAAQKEINNLSKKVSQMESAVEKTNVDLLFSIDIDAAHAAAEEAGMSYPTAENYGR
ncbi:MAG: hypothetical protein K6F68_09070 [Clostridiales bacterium]|nr:hypothetical protein [Clostridiales bacterium]